VILRVIKKAGQISYTTGAIMMMFFDGLISVIITMILYCLDLLVEVNGTVSDGSTLPYNCICLMVAGNILHS
jgi:hypothetical protein